MMERCLNDEVTGGGGERSLDEKLDGFKFKHPNGFTWQITVGIELHRLCLRDYPQLERRADEIRPPLINSTCSVTWPDGELIEEVRHAIPPKLLPR